jgi:hypothetical protein
MPRRAGESKASAAPFDARPAMIGKIVLAAAPSEVFC